MSMGGLNQRDVSPCSTVRFGSKKKGMTGKEGGQQSEMRGAERAASFFRSKVGEEPRYAVQGG